MIFPDRNVEFFNRFGYVIIDLLAEPLIEIFKARILEKIKLLAINILSIDGMVSLNDIENYHRCILSLDEHNFIMDWRNRFLSLSTQDVLNIDNGEMDSIFESYFGPVRPTIKYQDEKFQFMPDPAAGFRVVRPGEAKVAGYHSESTYGIWCLTLWLPLAGFDERYTLKLIPGSHLYRHPQDQILDNFSGLAKPFSDDYVNSLGCPVRPVLRSGQAILFHPDLVHGNGTNIGDQTRVSMELRFYPPSFANAGHTHRGIIR